MNKYLEFSIDYSGNIESIDEFSINNEIVEINDEMEVQTLIDKLTKVEGFHLSENRTEVRIWWNQNKTMDVHYRDYTEPDGVRLSDDTVYTSLCESKSFVRLLDNHIDLHKKYTKICTFFCMFISNSTFSLIHKINFFGQQ